MKTKEKIVFSAIELFNKKGASNTSVKKIAAEMKISSGNLHYHYKTKEVLIMAIWDKMSGELNELWSEPEIHTSEKAIAYLFYKLSVIFYEYRFFYLELPILLDNDPLLREIYGSRAKKILSTLKVFTDSWINAKFMKKFESEKDREFLIRNMWMVNQLWMHYWHTIYSKVTVDHLKDGMLQILSIYKPYFYKKSADKIYKYINEYS